MADVEQAATAVAAVSTVNVDKKAAKEAEAAASAEAILSWTTRYPAKLKAVVWNLKENSVRSVALFHRSQVTGSSGIWRVNCVRGTTFILSLLSLSLALWSSP